MKNQILQCTFSLLLIFGTLSLMAQDDGYEDFYEDDYSGEEYYDDATDLTDDIFRKSEFTIPSSPAFSLLGVTPEMVTRPGTVQDFKVDWRIKNYNLAPDLALEAQPMWALYYDRKGLDTYRRASPFMKTLSTLSLSFGTGKMDGLNHFAYAAKMTLYREKDPVSDPQILREMAVELAELEEPLRLSLERLKTELDTASDRETRLLIREEIFDTKTQLNDIRRVQKQKLIDMQTNYMHENWNSASVDVAIGKVMTFNNGLDTLNLHSAGMGFWVNGATGVGRNGLLTGIVKMRKIGENSDWLIGSSFRFGGYRFSFYGEMIFESIQNWRENGFSEDELFADKYVEDLGNSWAIFEEGPEAFNRWTMTYGGDFRLSNGIILNFSLRTKLDNSFKFKRLLPVANVTCLMR